jgi:integrase
MARRQYGTGSVYHRASDDRWIGAIQAGWTDKGTRRIITVSGRTRAEVLRKLRDKQRQIAKEGTPAPGSGRTTVKAWSEKWLTLHEKTVRPTSYITDAGAVHKWIIPTIGQRRLVSLTPDDVRAVSDAVRAAGRSSTTAKGYHAILTRILRAAIAEGHHISPWVLAVEPPVKAVSDRDAIPLPDALALLSAANARPDASRWVAALLQGMRQGECLGLTWECVDLDAGTIDVAWQLQPLPYLDRKAGTFRVPEGFEARKLRGSAHLVRPKTSQGTRLIPLVSWMTASLTEWRRVAPDNPWGLVWPGLDDRNGRSVIIPCPTKADRRAWYDLQDIAQVACVKGPAGRRYLLHEARHTTATLLLEGGVDPEVIMAILGHTSIIASKGYKHVSQVLSRRALDDVARKLELTAINPPTSNDAPPVS